MLVELDMIYNTSALPNVEGYEGYLHHGVDMLNLTMEYYDTSDYEMIPYPGIIKHQVTISHAAHPNP